MLLDARRCTSGPSTACPSRCRARTARRSTPCAGSSTWWRCWSAATPPDRLVACLDPDWRPAFRVEALPSYKAHRVGSPDGRRGDPRRRSTPQVPSSSRRSRRSASPRSARRARGRRRHRHPGRATGPVDVVTGDRDLFQLVATTSRCTSSTPPGMRDLQLGRRGRGRPRSTGSRPRVRRLRDAARRPQRRAARRARGRRQDRGGAGQRFGDLAGIGPPSPGSSSPGRR